MNGILGMIDLLMDSELNEDQKDLLETARLSGKCLLSISNNILDFSKIEAGKLQLEPRECDLPSSIESVERVHRAIAHAKQLSLRLKIDPALPRQLLVDPPRLRQILNNLIANLHPRTEKFASELH